LSEKSERDGIVEVENVEPLCGNYVQNLGHERFTFPFGPICVQPSRMDVALTIHHSPVQPHSAGLVPPPKGRGTCEQVHCVPAPSQFSRKFGGNAGTSSEA
jgi:hypothetical protein